MLIRGKKTKDRIMKVRKSILIILLIVLFAKITMAVEIVADGGSTKDPIFHLRIKNAATRLLYVVVNGVPMLMKSYDSYRRLALSRGLNTIVVQEIVSTNDKKVKIITPPIDDVTIYADVPPVPLKIIHTWDNAHNYVDLYVKEPGGETLCYSHRRSKLGGRIDIGADTVGYGPQIYTMSYPNVGVYEIFIRYWGGSRSELTEITTTVIMHQGTEKETRKVFQAILTGPGNQVFVGKVELK